MRIAQRFSAGFTIAARYESPRQGRKELGSHDVVENVFSSVPSGLTRFRSKFPALKHWAILTPAPTRSLLERAGI